MLGTSRDPSRLLPGCVVLDAPERVPAVWGSGDDVLWAKGEPLVIAGPPGVGKTTLAQQIALARASVTADLHVLGYPVEPRGDGRTLYVAADRPRQALRSMRRMLRPTYGTRELLDGLRIWSGPFTLDEPEDLAAFLREQAIGTVILDSIKDVAGDVSDGKVGADYNQAVQVLVANGIEVAAIHHGRKAQEGNRRPKRLDDLYGSTWIAAGAGSVLYLYGQAGDPVVELLHLKQPAAPVGPLTVVHDHATGRSSVTGGGNVREMVEAAPEGLTIKEAAAAIFATSEPTRSEVEKARRRLDRLVAEGVAEKVEGDGDKAPATYRTASATPETVITRDSDRDQSRSDHGEAENGLSKHHAAITAYHAPRSSAPDPPPTGEGADRDRDSGTLEDALRDPVQAEAIRASVDGEWV